MQTLANLRYSLLGVQVIGHVIGHAHITVEIEICIDVAHTKVMAQITNEHGLCSFFVHLFFFAKQGKQAEET